MTATDIFRKLKLAYPFLVAFKVQRDDEYDCYNLVLEMSDDCPDPEITFYDQPTPKAAIAFAIEWA